MKNFITVNDISDPIALAKKGIALKANPLEFNNLGKGKTLGLIFYNPSLRTRLSTQKAAMNLGMNVMVMSVSQDAWALEFNDGAVMNGTTVEHIKDAAAVMGLYCDVIGVRSFPGLADREKDYSEFVFGQFVKYAGVPVVSLESATLHPLQSLADLMTILEVPNVSPLERGQGGVPPKIVLTWAPHIKSIPQAVSNSFSSWMLKSGFDLTITHPKGFELCEDFTKGAKIEYNQEMALENADFIYVKNWSSYKEYGKVYEGGENWMLTHDKLKNAPNAKVMHCMPVRRNVELSDEILDSDTGITLMQARNREYAAQAVLMELIKNEK